MSRVWLPLIRRLLVVALVCLAAPLAAAEHNAGYMTAFESIKPDQLKAYVDYFADDAMEGREAGSRGNRTVGDYLVTCFTSLKLRPAGTEGGYLQMFEPNYRNILAMLEGSDPKLKEEVILIGAHYDHVGYGTWRNSRGPVGYIHNGADDNASGVAALLEVAQALTILPKPPRRSILLVAWDAEEKGMLGSKHWVAQPTLPIQRIVFAINMDMIGGLREDQLRVFCSRSGYGLRQLISSENDLTHLKLEFLPGVKPNADHYPMFEHDIPVLTVNTGVHDEYHTPRDDANLINHDGLRRVAQLMFAVAYDLAERDRLPAFRRAARHESDEADEESPVTLPVGPLRLGITWRVDDAEPGAVILTHVFPNTPAAAAGLQPGDRVYQIAGKDFADDEQFAKLAKTLPDPIELLIERNGRLQTVMLHLTPQPAAKKRAA